MKDYLNLKNDGYTFSHQTHVYLGPSSLSILIALTNNLSALREKFLSSLNCFAISAQIFCILALVFTITPNLAAFFENLVFLHDLIVPREYQKVLRPDQESNLEILAETRLAISRRTIGPSGLRSFTRQSYHFVSRVRLRS